MVSAADTHPSPTVESAPDELFVAACLLDPHGTVVLAQGDASVLGATTRELEGKSAVEHLPALRERIQRALGGQASSAVIGDATDAVHIRIEPCKDGGKRGCGALVIAFKLTTHVLEDALRERDELRLMFEQAPGIVWCTDVYQRLTYAAGHLADPPRQVPFVVGMTVADAFHVKNGAEEPLITHHAAAIGGTAQAFRYLHRNHWYQVRIDPLLDRRLQIVGAVGFALDVTKDVRNEASLAESKHELERAQRIAHIGSWEFDPKANRMTWSTELYRIFGLDPASELPAPLPSLPRVAPEDRDTVRTAQERALNAGLPFNLEFRVLRPDGTIRRLYASGEPARSPNGEVTRISGTMLDITERWQAQLKLEATVSLLQATLESTNDGILVIDTAGRFAAHNSRFVEMWRLAPESIVDGVDAATLAVVADQLEDPAAFVNRVHELYDHADQTSFDVLQFKDGRVYERVSKPQRVRDRIVGRVWSFRDVTEREHVVSNSLFLAEATRLLGSLDVDHALKGVVRVAIQRGAAACAIDLHDHDGKPRRIAFATDARGDVSIGEVHRSVMRGRTSVCVLDDHRLVSVPLTVRRRVEGAIAIATRLTHTDGAGDVDFVERLGVRISSAIENARLYQEVQAALHAREDFLSVAAHELRGPVAAMRLAVQSLRGGQAPGRTVTKMCHVIEREERRLTRLVDELLDVTRIRSGQFCLNFEPVNLAEVTRTIASGLAVEIARSGSVLSVDASDDVVGVWDRARIEQIVTNLLSNSIKFGMGRPIDVTVTADVDVARLRVSDHGIGIASDEQGRIFQPFERAVSTRHFGGLGLGLYIVRTIVSGLDGDIQLSSAIDKGSTFTVTLPLTRRGDGASEASPRDR